MEASSIVSSFDLAYRKGELTLDENYVAVLKVFIVLKPKKMTDVYIDLINACH